MLKKTPAKRRIHSFVLQYPLAIVDIEKSGFNQIPMRSAPKSTSSVNGFRVVRARMGRDFAKTRPIRPQQEKGETKNPQMTLALAGMLWKTNGSKNELGWMPILRYNMDQLTRRRLSRHSQRSTVSSSKFNGELLSGPKPTPLLETSCKSGEGIFRRP